MSAAHAEFASRGLVGTPLIHTRSIDEAERLQSTINSPVRADRSRDRGAFEWRASRLKFGDIGIVSSWYRSGVRGHTANVDQQFSILFAHRGGGEANQRKQTLPIAAGACGAIVSPSTAASFSLAKGYRGVQLSIPMSVMMRTFEAFTGVPTRSPLQFEIGIDVTRSTGADVLRFVQFILEEARRESNTLRAPLVASRLSDAFVHSLLLGLPHDGSHRLAEPRPSFEPALVRRVEEYLAANAHLPISVADLSRAFGVSTRTLHAAFQKHREHTPMSFLRERRFELARHQLAQSPTRSVTEIALACGFEHLGRFSAGYSARFGESPSAARVRSRGSVARNG